MLFQTNQSIQDNKLKALNLRVESVRAKIRKMIRTQQETFAHKFLNDFEPEVRKFAKNTYEKMVREEYFNFLNYYFEAVKRKRINEAKLMRKVLLSYCKTGQEKETLVHTLNRLDDQFSISDPQEKSKAKETEILDYLMGKKEKEKPLSST